MAGRICNPCWPTTAAEARATAVETLLERLVALNAKRAAEEAAGTVRWLRPEFQARTGGAQAGLDVAVEAEGDAAPVAAPAKAVADVLAASPQPLSMADLEMRFQTRGRWRERLPTILDTLAALGRARQLPGEEMRWSAA